VIYPSACSHSRQGGDTRRLAIVANAAGVGAGFRTIATEMTHLQAIPAFDILHVARFLPGVRSLTRKKVAEV
jgi:hypothetical protein